MKKLRKINCSLLPPCQKVLQQKILRAQYVSQVWSKAADKNPSEGLCHHNMGGKRKKIDGSGCGILDRLSLTDLLNVLTEVKRMMMQKTKKKMMRGVKMNLLRMMKRTRNDEHMKP